MELKDNNEFIEYDNFNDSFNILKNIKTKKQFLQVYQVFQLL